jgi:hypothetical protein
LGFFFVFCKFFPSVISKDRDGVPAMFDGSICMEKPSAFIPKFNPFNGAPLLPIDLLLVKEVLKML